MKPKPCPECPDSYIPQRIGQKTCPKPACAISYARKHPDKGLKANKAIDGLQKRARSRQRREKLEGLMTRSDWLKRAQKTMNRYVLARDFGLGCISCGIKYTETVYGGQMDCGHYRSVGSSPATRFNLKNMHAQCVKCNRYLNSNSVEYRKGLVRKIGLQEVEKLESINSALKPSVAYLKRITEIFSRRRNRLLRRNNYASESDS